MFEPTNEIKGRYDITKNIVTGEASCFIIPNGAGVCNQFICGKERRAEELKKYCELNGITTFDPEETKLIQVWWHSDDFGTDNMYRHGCSAIDDKGDIYRWGIETPEYMPINLIRDCREGDIIDIKVPIWIRKKGKEGESVDAIAELKLTMQQLGYRYERFGAFEEALQYVS